MCCCASFSAGCCCVFAPCVPAVKQRIRAIKNIGKITKAMKMVAASKMRNAQLAVENSRGMVEPFVRLFGDHPGAQGR
jgi:F-type H+-transporting ATPase subunit gamma